jgi:hypothetical protein
MSGTDSISTEAVIASKARGRAAVAEAETLHAKVAQGPTSAQVLMAHVEKEGEAIFSVQMHKAITLKTARQGDDLVRDYFSLDISGARDKGKLRIYSMGDRVVLWHDDAKSPVTIWASNIASTSPMGAAW